MSAGYAADPGRPTGRRGTVCRGAVCRGTVRRGVVRRLRAGVALAAGFVLGGCASAAVPPPPPVVPVPDLEVEIPRFRMGEAFLPPPPPAGAPADPILFSEFAYHPGIVDRASWWMDIFSARQADAFEIWLQRMSRYEALVDSVIAETGVPHSLRYLPVIESGYSPRAISVASAVGMWQFMAPVARSFGMRVDGLVDERRDPALATVAAIRYLDQLHDRFGSWFVALAAYNGGPTRVARLIREHAPLAPVNDSLFLAIRDHLPRETREYIPKFLAAATIAEHPENFGIRRPVPLPSWRWDAIELPDAVSLDVIAEAAGVSEDEVRELNPQIVRGVTPRGRTSRLRLPVGTGSRAEAAMALLPRTEWVTVTEHVVAAGETLSGIAERYGIPTSELRDANPGVRPRTLQIGARLMVPLLPGGAARAREIRTGSSAVRAIPESGIHVVRPGENLWVIARRYGLGSETLMEWNGLSGDPVVHPGDQLRLRPPGSRPGR